MRICLINPPNVFQRPIGYEWYPNIFTLPYLGMGYVTAAIEKAGYDVTHLDCPLQGFDEKYIFKYLDDNKFDVIGLSNFYYNLLPVSRIVRYINSHFEDTFVFLGGFMPTLDYDTIFNMKMKIDCCIVGAGEVTAVELIKKLEAHEDWTSINGISYIKNGVIQNNKRQTCVQNLDVIPFPYRSEASGKTKHVSVLSSRGCYGDCTFCGEKEYAVENASPHMRYRSVDNLIEEIVLLWKEYHFERLRFNDSNFLDGSNARKLWLKEFVYKIEGLNFKFSYTCNARANDIITHRELLPVLYRSGLEAIFLGIESFSQRQLDLYSKRTTVEQNITALRILKNCGIKVEIGLILVEPFVTVEEFEENLICLENTAFFDIVDITQSFISSSCTLISIPGTRMYNILVQRGVSSKKNSLGYIFLDRRMEIIHSAMIEWERVIKSYSEKRYLIYKARAKKKNILAEELSEWYKQLLKLDYCFLKDLVSIVKNRIGSRQQIKDIMVAYRRQFEEVSEKINFDETEC